MDRNLLFGEGGLFGLSADLSLNLISELIGLVLSVILISVALEHYRGWREKSKWRASRQRIALDVAERHSNSLNKFANSLRAYQSRGKRIGNGLHARLQTSLDATTRYYERNVFFLPPNSLAHFENYRFEFKRLVTLLGNIIKDIDHGGEELGNLMAELRSFDFCPLDRHVAKFGKTLGQKVPDADISGEEANELLHTLASLPPSQLREVLG